jgi:hypothetical protein
VKFKPLVAGALFTIGAIIVLKIVGDKIPGVGAVMARV